MVAQSFSLLSKNKSLVLYPIVFDFVALLVGIAVAGFSGGSKITFKLTLNVGLPSISSVVDQTVMANGVNFSINNPSIPLVMILIFLVFLIIQSFLQAGYIGLLHEVVQEREVPFDCFLDYGKRFWLRFLGIQLIVTGIMFVAGMLLVFTLKIVGVILLMILFLVFRVLYIYWEFTVVVDDCTIGEAFTRSRDYFRNRVPETTNIILLIVVINALFAFLVNSLWNPVAFSLNIVAYGFVASGLQIVLMATLHKISRSK